MAFRNISWCFSCRRFRTYSLLVLALVIFSQSISFYYMLYNVREAEGPTVLTSRIPTTLQQTNEHNLGYAGKFSCEIVSKTAISAIRRANTQACKKELSEIACRLKSRKLFPKNLPNYCLRKDANPGVSLGCFKDHGQQRILSGYGARIQNLTVRKCIDICVQSAFPFAGVRSGKECYCGVQKPLSEQMLPHSYCSVPCDGQSSQYCGGVELTEVFDTGVPAKEPLKLQDPIVNGTTNIAFILTLNGRSLRQITRLLRLMYRPHHVYYIHVDARQDYLYRNLVQLEQTFPNIRLARQRKSTIWGGVSLLDVLLEAMKELLEFNQKWEFVFNLSESDFPLKSIEKLEILLAANRGRNFLKSHGRQARQFIHKQGLDRVFHQCESRMWRIGDRTLPSGIRFDGGSDWFGLSRDFVDYAVNGQDPLVTGLKQLFHFTLLPAESFFHVLVLNSKFCHTYADNNLRMTFWKRSQGCLCQHRAVVDWCGCSPMVYRTSDWNQISAGLNRSVIYFARKFESVIDQSVINRIEEMHLTNRSVLHQGWDSYWENVYHVTDLQPKNKALLAISNSFIRQKLSRVNIEPICNPKPVRTVSVTSYFHRDHYQGDLFLYDLQLNDATIQVELLVKPLSKSVLSSSRSTISILQVGSDFDPKEQTLRNRIGALSQLSKLTAVFKWSSLNVSTNETVQLVWFDPTLKVRAVQDVNISETNKVYSQNFEMEPPLMSGVWTVIAVHLGTKLASTEFLIVPLDDDIDSHIAKNNPALSLWESLLDLEPSTRKKRVVISSLKAKDRHVHLDSLVSEFFALEDVCLVRQPLSCLSHLTWPLCSKTVWSSLSPDPKSIFIK